MRVLVVNPNSSEEFSKVIRGATEKRLGADIELTVLNPSKGPRWINGRFEEVLSALFATQLVLENRELYDAFVIACYGAHASVYAAREVTTKPVVGIGEASMLVATLIATKFSIVTTGLRWKPLLEQDVARIGLTSRCASVRVVPLNTADLERESADRVGELLEQEGRAAIEEDGAEAICLGCAGMAGLSEALSARLGVPVLDGVLCAIELARLLVELGLGTSRVGAYAELDGNAINGLDDIFSSAYAPRHRLGDAPGVHGTRAGRHGLPAAGV
jgi:allantoin racemase